MISRKSFTLIMEDSLENKEKTDRQNKGDHILYEVGRILVLIKAPLFVFVGYIYVRVFSPFLEQNHFLSCPIHTFTGLYCPGCGDTRALYCLARLDFIGMMDHNVILFPTLLVFGWWGLAEYTKLLFRRQIMWLPKRIPFGVLLGIFLFLLVYFVLRNIPFFTFTWLAP